MIEDWLKIPYVDYGRSRLGCDCWGLVRMVRHELFGHELPSFGLIAPDNKRALTKAANTVISENLTPTTTPKHGTIATVWRGAVCTHVGIVLLIDGRLAVLETNKGSGPRWMRLGDFQKIHPIIKYYD